VTPAEKVEVEEEDSSSSEESLLHQYRRWRWRRKSGG
jgi:hypothetical protein